MLYKLSAKTKAVLHKIGFTLQLAMNGFPFDMTNRPPTDDLLASWRSSLEKLRSIVGIIVMLISIAFYKGEKELAPFCTYLAGVFALVCYLQSISSDINALSPVKPIDCRNIAEWCTQDSTLELYRSQVASMNRLITMGEYWEMEKWFRGKENREAAARDQKTFERVHGKSK